MGGRPNGTSGTRGLKTTGSGSTHLRIVNPGDVAGLLADATKGTLAADMPAMPVQVKKPKAVSRVPALSELWDEVVPLLTNSGVLHEPDAVILEAMLRHMLAFRDASDELITSGVVVIGRDDVEVRNPADLVMRGQSAALMGYLKEMGLTLVARARIPSTDNGTPVEGNPFQSADTGS